MLALQEKASARAEEIRERRKSEKRLKTRIEELKAELKQLKNSSETEPSPTSSKNSKIIELREASETRALSVLIILSTMIPFRAVPKILNILTRDGWIPHFTSVLNWTMRVGLAKLEASWKSSLSLDCHNGLFSRHRQEQSASSVKSSAN